MDPDLVLRDTQLQVRPGDIVGTTATVRSTSDRVEQYDLDVLGPAAAWAEVIPSTISVIQRGENTVRLQFRPPVGPGTPSGTVPFALRCASREDPDSRAVVEGDLAVGAIHEIAASLTPAVYRGRRTGRWTARFDNRGTAPARLRLAASDERRALGFATAPEEIEIGPGDSGAAFLKARAKRPTLLGGVKNHRVRLTYTRVAAPGEAGSEGFLDATFEHIPVMSRAVAALLGVALVGGLVAAVLLSQSKPRDEVAPDSGTVPVTPAGFTAERGGPGVVRMAWSPVPGAIGFRIDKLARGNVVETSAKVEPQLGVYEWKDLNGGSQACFRMVALNDVGASKPTEPGCVTVEQTPAGPATPPGGTPPSTGGPGPTDTSTPTGGPGGTGSGTGTGTGTGSGVAKEPRDTYVVYRIYLGDDQKILNDPRVPKLAADIETALGVSVVIAGADTSKRLSAKYPGFVVLYTDGFSSVPVGEKFCADNLATLHTIDPQIYCLVHGD
jgi:hypothetical protein